MIKDNKRCKNCDHHLLLDQKFCHECGQKTDTHRINFHFLIHEIQHSVFHVDGGILFTLKELFTRPGHTLREYLEGKRKNHFKPVLLIMILGTITVLLSHFLNAEVMFDMDKLDVNKNNAIENASKSLENQPAENKAILKKITSTNIVADTSADKTDSEKETIEELKVFEHLKKGFDWVNDHYALSMLLMIPFFALSFYLGFLKYKLNFPEWLVITTFLMGQTMLVYIVFMFINKFIGDGNQVLILITSGLYLWTMLQFFNHRPKWRIALRTVFSIFLMYFFFIFILVAFVVTVLFNPL